MCTCGGKGGISIRFLLGSTADVEGIVVGTVEVEGKDILLGDSVVKCFGRNVVVDVIVTVSGIDDTFCDCYASGLPIDVL